MELEIADFAKAQENVLYATEVELFAAGSARAGAHEGHSSSSNKTF
jgi:hypothetical protein